MDPTEEVDALVVRWDESDRTVMRELEEIARTVITRAMETVRKFLNAVPEMVRQRRTCIRIPHDCDDIAETTTECDIIRAMLDDTKRSVDWIVEPTARSILFRIQMGLPETAQ